MKLTIQDTGALSAISPSALSSFARSLGWSKVDTYGNYSDVYSGENVPEIIIPRTNELGDYSAVVSRLVGTFAMVTDTDELSIYRDLSSTDQDVVRVRVPSGIDGTLPMKGGVGLFEGARDLVLTTARSLINPQQSVYQGRASNEVTSLLERVRFGQTEQGSYVVTLLVEITPPAPQLNLAIETNNVPIERKLTHHLAESLKSAKAASTNFSIGNTNAFSEVISQGVNWNLCNALDSLITPYSELEISVKWSNIFPTQEPRSSIGFNEQDAINLRKAAKQFKLDDPEPAARLRGFVKQLKRDPHKTEGNVRMVTSYEGKERSIQVNLNDCDYNKAIQAHQGNALVFITGKLEKSQTPWRLLDAEIKNVIQGDDEPKEESKIPDLFTRSGNKEF